MNSKLQYLTASAFAISMAAPFATYAAPVTLQFDPTGAGNTTGAAVTVAMIDQTVGSALAVGGNTAVQNFLANKVDLGTRDTGFTLYYQANLGTMSDGASLAPVFTNGNGGNYFTFVAGFGEKVAGAEGYPGTSSFVLDSSNPVNYFQMYANSGGNNLTGEGFASGTLILSGTLTSVDTSNFQITNTNPVSLDQFGTNNWLTSGLGGTNQTTVTGAGTSDFSIQISFADPDYFVDAASLTSGGEILWSFFNNSQVDPFRQADPSQCFSTPGSTCESGGGIVSVGTLGAINGNLNPTAGTIGPNFMFQADGNQSFATQEVPEPASIALIGLGLSLIGFFNRRRYTA